MFEINDTAIVIIDVQEKLLNVMDGKEVVVENISKLAKAAKVLGVPVLWCQQYPKALGETAGEISEHLDSEPVNKMCFSCCLSDEFDGKLADAAVKKVVVCGIESHVCVYQTARDLKRKGFDVEVVEDAVTSRTAENKKIAIERMRSEGIAISSVEMALFDLMKTAEHPGFKQISKLIK